MKRLSFKSITLMCCMALSFGACQDIVTYNDNYDDEMASSGAPVIDAVYDSNPWKITGKSDTISIYKCC